MQFDSQSVRYLQDRGKTGVALARQGLVEALSPKAGVASKLTHSLRPRDRTQRFRNKRCVVTRLFETGFEVQGDVLLAPRYALRNV